MKEGRKRRKRNKRQGREGYRETKGNKGKLKRRIMGDGKREKERVNEVRKHHRQVIEFRETERDG